MDKRIRGGGGHFRHHRCATVASATVMEIVRQYKIHIQSAKYVAANFIIDFHHLRQKKTFLVFNFIVFYFIASSFLLKKNTNDEPNVRWKFL